MGKAILGRIRSTPQESTAIPKRKPPSQRPEMKMDETASAIARLRDDAKPDKATKADRLASDASKSAMSHAVRGNDPRKANSVAPSTSTKRPKSPGS